MTFYTPLERLAKSAKECGWDVKADPEVVLRLIEIAKAAEASAPPAKPACKFCGVDTEHPCVLANALECQNFGFYPNGKPARAALGTQPVKEKNDA